ncbi:MAG: FAD-dependent oxidoreductase [Bryobacteraceae bacterium]|nr:FAD-dependent oxidoreductase [Bryobacteraceae bacterium]
MKRRHFMPALIGLTAKGESNIAGGFVYEARNEGHRIRDRAIFRPPAGTRRARIVIIGGGMAGLSAAWWLRKQGFDDFLLLEGEDEPGGNARWGQNDICAYPWASHYVPVPNTESTLVRELFAELGLMDAAGNFDERWLCHSPQERLFLHGRWQWGLDPEAGTTATDREHRRIFAEHLRALTATSQFKLPMALGRSPDASLDQLSMRDWLAREKLTSAYLGWEVDYGCRDDYGGASGDISAWAGLHYHAARQHDTKGPFTWPEGNGWLARRLVDRVKAQLVNGVWSRNIERVGNRWHLRTTGFNVEADALIYAAPSFLLPYLLEGAPKPNFDYSPWLTANLTIEQPMETAWDNVLYDSPSLGYVNATHQMLASRVNRSVWTYYLPFTGATAAQRRRLQSQDYAYWKESILADLERAHPGLRKVVSRIDIFRQGHAMRRPRPGFLAESEAWKKAVERPTFRLANSDVSGLPLFEEAQYRGVEAARACLAALGFIKKLDRA